MMLRVALLTAVVACAACADVITNVHELCISAEAHADQVDGWVAEVCNAYQVVAKAEMLIEQRAHEGEHTDAKRKNEFIRFGKRKNEFIRFGKRAADVEDPELKRKNEFIRFGKRSADAPEADKRKNEFIRFGKRKNEFIRFGKRAAPAAAQEQEVEKKKNEFIRFGKRKNEFIRFG